MLYNNYVVLGMSNTGKTTFINQEIIPVFKKENVYALDFKGSLDVMQQNRRHTVETLIMEAKGKKNCLFVVDDGTGVLKAGNSNVISDLLYLLNTARHDNNYYVFVYHGTAYYPLAFTPGIHAFIFFPLSDTREQVMKNIPSLSPDEIKAVMMKKKPCGQFVAIYKNT